MERVQHLSIPLEDIIQATKNFNKENFIAKGGYGSVYKGELPSSNGPIIVAVKRLDPESDQGKQEFTMELTTLSIYKHKNLVSLLGFCDAGKEKMLVYEYESRGSLDNHIQNPQDLTWIRRLEISIGAARGLNYLHDEVGPQHRIIHRDVKSANILLNKDWEAKVADLGLSKIGPAHMQHTFLVTNAAGTLGYLDPEYYRTNVLTKESDVYSFGVVLFEILCGRLSYAKRVEDSNVYLVPLAKRKYEENKLDEIIIPMLRKQMNMISLNTFSAIAYQCLKDNRSERPTMGLVIDKLEKALEFQKGLTTTKIGRVGPWGTKSNGSPENRWEFFIEKDHKLKMITIDHGDLIYSLTITSESKGVPYTSAKVGGWKGGNTVSEVSFEDDEELIRIEGTVGVYAGYTMISSLKIFTNRITRGPFGRPTDDRFSVAWEEGNFGGFYGLAGNYIYSIGVYIKASSDNIIRVGKWGAKFRGGPNGKWSFLLEKNHHLKKITIDHSYLIHSLMFTTEYKGQEKTSSKAGGSIGGDKITEVVTFEWDEEIIGISCTIGVSRGFYAGFTIISSLAFITNKKTHGPYGSVTTRPFTVPWEKESFAGFYGIAGGFIDAIGVYLKATHN